MGQCRNLLPVSKLDGFRQWLANNGHDVRETKAQYAVFDIQVGKDWIPVYVRDKTHAGGKTVHASIYGGVVPLAKQFLKGNRE